MSIMTLEDLVVDNPGLTHILSLEETQTGREQEPGINEGFMDVSLGHQASREEYEAMACRSDRYLEALSFFEEGLDEFFEDDLTEQNKDQARQRMAAVGYIIKRYMEAVRIIQSEKQSLHDSITRLEAKSSLYQDQIDTSRQRLMAAMKRQGVNSLETPLVKLVIENSLQRPVLDPDTDIKTLMDNPHVNMTIQIDEEAVTAELEKKQAIPGFRISDSQVTLSIA